MRAPRMLRVRAQVLGNENALINLVPKDGLVERASEAAQLAPAKRTKACFALDNSREAT